MKAYFLDLLNNLDKLAGLRQVDKIMATSPNPKAEINELIEVLVRVSEQFPYIPQKDQKNIISAAVVTDVDFTSLNARTVYKWLAIHKEKYFKEAAHVQQQKDENWVPLTGEARMARLKEWEQSLAGFDDKIVSGDKFVPFANVREIDSHGLHHVQPTAEDKLMIELKSEYGRECCDLYTGRIKPGMPDFDSWLKDKPLKICRKVKYSIWTAWKG